LKEANKYKRIPKSLLINPCVQFVLLWGYIAYFSQPFRLLVFLKNSPKEFPRGGLLFHLTTWGSALSWGPYKWLKNILRVGVKSTGPGSFQWCPAIGQGAMGANCSRGSSSWTWGRTSSLWGWRSPGTGCAACSGWPCFGRGVGL